jgi:hypothetical protein
MSKGIIPINSIAEHAHHLSSQDPLPSYPLDMDELMESQGFKEPDEFTYTTRYTVPEEKREQLKAALRQRAKDPNEMNLTEEDVEAFIAKMEEMNWSVSFLVDCY